MMLLNRVKAEVSLFFKPLHESTNGFLWTRVCLVEQQHHSHRMAQGGLHSNRKVRKQHRNKHGGTAFTNNCRVAPCSPPSPSSRSLSFLPGHKDLGSFFFFFFFFFYRYSVVQQISRTYSSCLTETSHSWISNSTIPCPNP